MSVGSGRLLEREQKEFWMATVQPVHQLTDDLRFRLGEVQHQQLTVHPSNWEHVIQQVYEWYEIKTCLNVHSDFDQRALVEMPDLKHLSRRNSVFCCTCFEK